MLGFMDYVQNAFYDATRWNNDNSYSTLTASSQALLDFDIPHGLRLNVSSLSAPNFATSYSIGTSGLVDGTLAYLYSSRPLAAVSKSSDIDLHHFVRGYRHLEELQKPDEPWWWEVWQRGRRIDRRDTLLYGRLFLPTSTLEALYLRRLSPTKQLKISCVSDNNMNNGGTILALLQNDVGKYSIEYLYSTDSGLLGARGLYNFGPDPRKGNADTADETGPGQEHVHGRFSAGAEVYYGLLNKSGGMSTGIRFSTLPRHRGFPYTMALTVNPLMGNLSSTYAVKAGRNIALCSKFDFNFYSYESDVMLGCELWRRNTPRTDSADAFESGARVSEADSNEPSPTASEHNPARLAENERSKWGTRLAELQRDQADDANSAVLKGRVDQNWNIGLVWEGRMKDLLFTLGASFDLKRREQIIRAVGVEIQYSS